MAQRAAVSQPVPQQQYEHMQKFPTTNHLMPGSLRTIPDWYQNGPFRYNLRFMVGFVPGLLLLFTVTGKTMMTFTALGAIGTIMVRGTGFSWMSMVLSLAHLFVLEVVNIYCMMPLVWQSILNAPLFAVFHFFIAVSGMWWCLQDEEFKRQDPRFVLLSERVLFYLSPLSMVTTVTWVGGMLFGRYALAYTVCLTGLLSISLFMTPLQSSLAKPQTPTDVGLIQHRFVAWLYIMLQLLVSPVLYTALNHTGSLHSTLMLCLLIAGSPFLLTLLEAQGLFYWTGLGPRAVQMIRWITGSTVLALLSVLVYTHHSSSTYLPLLLVPILFTQLGFISSASSFDHTHLTTPTLLLAVVLGSLYSATFFLLPWSISHQFSFLSLPLSVVQVLLWCLAIATVVIATIWKRTTLQLLVIYNSIFVFCEYLLNWDGVYPTYVAMVTTATAVVMFWRLHSIKQLPANSSLLSISLHLTKLSLLLPTHPHTLTTSALVTVVAIFIISYLLLRMLLFDQGQSSSSQLFVYSGLLSVGLILSIEPILTPLWTAVTHQSPSGASLVATILAAVGVFILSGLSQLRTEDGRPSILSVLPHGLFVMAALVGVLQPEFNLSELVESFVIAVSDSSVVPEEVYLTAWGNLLTWVTLYTAVFALVLMLYLNPLTVIATSFLGVLAGFLTAIAFVHFPPFSLLGMLYAIMLGVGGAILGRVFVSSKESRSPLDTLLFAVLLISLSLCYLTEWNNLPRNYLPWKPYLEYYALPCTKLFTLLSLILSVAFRIKMHTLGGQSYLPLTGNLCCLFFFLFAILHPFHQMLEVSVLLSSCVFLLAQPDNLIFPKSSNIFLAPSLVLSVTVLYVISATRIVPLMITMAREEQSMLFVARVVELLLLVTTIPGQALFLYHLWSGKQLQLSFIYVMLYISPSAFLPQFGSSTASGVLGGIGVLSFCLLMIGDYSTVKIL